MNWKYTDLTRRIVSRVNDDGTVDSMLASVLPEEAWVDDPDPAPPSEKSPLDRVIEYIAAKPDAPQELKAIAAESAQLASAAQKS